MTDARSFVATGREHAQRIEAAAAATAGRFPSPVLDLGCGVGRVLAHLDDTGADLYGCDLNEDAISWCRAHLRGDFRTTNVDPPLPYPDRFFGLVYAISVLTHLPEKLQRKWIDELHRIVRLDGVVLVTTHGRSTTAMLTDSERRRFDEGRLVVRGSLVPGSNRCVAWHPEPYLRDLVAGRFDVVELHEAAIGDQDLVMLRPV
jgi:SAM-dependent methyltransferase